MWKQREKCVCVDAPSLHSTGRSASLGTEEVDGPARLLVGTGTARGAEESLTEAEAAAEAQGEGDLLRDD